MKKVGSSLKILSGLIVGGIILCLLFKMLSREGFKSACILGGKCNTANGDTTCTADEGKYCCMADGKGGYTRDDLSYTLTCKEGKDTQGKWYGQQTLSTCQASTTDTNC